MLKEYTCQLCGKTYTRTPGPRSIFCSRACYWAIRIPTGPLCTECDRPRWHGSLCQRHADRLKRTGSTQLREKPSDEVRFWSRVNKDGPVPQHRLDLGPCWLWTLSTVSRGYALFAIKGKSFKAHRYSYELLVGPIPEGLELDHLCSVRHCVNPTHLDPVPHVINLQRANAVRVLKTFCKRGHHYVEENVYRDARGRRFCRPCKALVARENRLKAHDSHRALAGCPDVKRPAC